jgi:hypothetical protein
VSLEQICLRLFMSPPVVSAALPCPQKVFYPELWAVAGALQLLYLRTHVLSARACRVLKVASIWPHCLVQVRGVDALKVFSQNLIKAYVPPPARVLSLEGGASSVREAELQAQVGCLLYLQVAQCVTSAIGSACHCGSQCLLASRFGLSCLGEQVQCVIDILMCGVSPAKCASFVTFPLGELCMECWL